MTVLRSRFRPARAAVGMVAAAALGLAGLVASTPAQADPTPTGTPLASDVREPKLPPRVTPSDLAALKKAAKKLPKSTKRLRSAGEGTGTGVPIGGVKSWVTLDDEEGVYEPANFVLRGLGSKIEVWVQDDIDFPDGDCRNDGVRNVVTDAQVQSLITEFDANIRPKEATRFSTAPDRTGVDAGLVDELGGGDPNYYVGDGAKTVVLVSNIRDANYTAPTTPDGQTFIVGFFAGQVNNFFDRNVMSIDAFDWVHRTGANPVNDAAEQTLCSPKQPARPHQYEATFAHEYQHLLESYQSPAQATWLNEGLSDYAQTAVGYVHTEVPFPQPGYDSHIACFQGSAPDNLAPYCGPENSLTQWGDQGDSAILADYGAAYSFVTYLRSRYGADIITALHRSPKAGLLSLQAYLDQHDSGMTTRRVLHDWVAQNALDRLLDHGATGLSASQRSRFTATRLSSTINWSAAKSYASPGAPPNGSDYVLARAAGTPVTANTLSSLTFTGAKTYPAEPLTWETDDRALYSGAGLDLDRAAIYRVSVPKGSPKLTFDSRFNIESRYDLGAVQVSTDGGKIYTSIAGSHTVAAHARDADPRVVGQLPGLAGSSRTYTRQTYDLKKYAGKKILLSFRYLTDGETSGNTGVPGASGWWVKNVRVGTTVVTTGATLQGALSATGARPIPVVNWNLQLIGWKTDGTKVSYSYLPDNSKNTVSLSGAALRKRVAGMDRMAVIVTVSDPLEVASYYARYQLKINGALQPGG